ncbi:DNA cytosine methyltransferase [Gammaproteobacteria bacterium]|nr:DNA cytosine methyltransferase [Gammaproteobacteria bacterium]
MKPSAKNLTFIDLFAGCGGLSLGLEQAGFYPLYVNELNKDALETYLLNRDKHYPHLRERFHSHDIKKLIKNKNFFEDLLTDLKKTFRRDFRTKRGSVDLIAGGPPCQGYSGIGIRRSYSVDKVQLPSNHLYQDMAHFVHQIHPKMFLFENVEGLLNARWTKNGKKGEIFEDVLKTFRSIPGYRIGFKLIHAKDYGVPQNRPRILLIGIREDIKTAPVEGDGDDALERGFLPEPKFGAPDIRDVFSDLIDNRFEYGGTTSKYPRDPKNKWQERIRRNPSGRGHAKKSDVLTEHDYSNHSETVIERFSSMIQNNGKIPPHLKTKKFAQRLLPAKWGDKGPTITACSLPDDFVHYKQARSLTVREWARLQTFPDWYQFAGKRTTGGLRRAGNPRQSVFDREVPKYTQIGNAVPVQLAEKVGVHFKKILKSVDH